MIQKITTESGRVYRLIGGRCSRGDWSSFTLIKAPYCIDREDLVGATTWTEIWAAPKHPIQIGLCLAVEGKDEWYLSTPIVSIEEIEDVE